MSAPEVCPAHRHDREDEERVLCFWEPHVAGAWGFICSSCWQAMLDGAARRQEWELEE
jgi:hypothetical protein